MFILPDLPYPADALAPVMSADTLHTHHDKHHRAYVDKTNKLAAEAGMAGRTLEQVVRDTAGRGAKELYNQAAQAWNHAFLWQSLRPPGGAPATDGLARAIQAFGGGDVLGDALIEAGTKHFGSGWLWLTTDGRTLKVVTTHDAGNTLTTDGQFPLLVCDLWEHAYYLDHKNDREGFLGAWFESLANWDFAGRQFAAAETGTGGFVYPAPTSDERRPESAGIEHKTA